MNKKIFTTAIALLGLFATTFAQEIGVKIGEITWATRNVGAPGVFVDNPEDMGMFYQWNSQIGWTTEKVPSDGTSVWDGEWDGNGAEIWEETNNVCPIGWRIPTDEEFTNLIEFEIEYTFDSGYTFGENDNTIFLPETGDLWLASGSFRSGWGSYSYYWASPKSTTTPYCLEVSAKGLYVGNYKESAFGHSIRCVKDESISTNLENIALLKKTEIVGYYNFMGQKLPNAPEKGMYIVVYSNGTSEKIMK